MQIEFDPFIIGYNGNDADNQMLELGLLAQSIQGAARLLGTAGNFVVTGQYIKKTPALSVRVLAGRPRPGSYELPVTIISMAPLLAPVLPIITDIAKEAATSAVKAVVNYIFTRNGGSPQQADATREIAQVALQEMGLTARTAIESVERMATGLRPAARQFAAPVGTSCDTASIGVIGDRGLLIDRAMKAAIDAPEPMDVGPEQHFEILISELDLRNRSYKCSIRNDDDQDRRVQGEILDPLLLSAGNPYSKALDSQRWISVAAKPILKDGDIERLDIYDIIPSMRPE